MTSLSFTKKYKIRNYPTFFYALFSIWAVIGFLPILPRVVPYVVSILYALYLFSFKNVDRLVGAFLLYIPLELSLAQPDSVFQSWLRYGLFLLLLINVSGFLQTKRLRSYREQIFMFMMWGCAILAIGSFASRFLGINYMRVPEGMFYGFDMMNTPGLFAGLTIHSMMLGPIAGIGACFFTNKAMSTKKKLHWIFVLMSLAAVFFSASRAAVIASVLGVIITIYLQSKTMNRFIDISIVTLVLLASTFTLWSNVLTGVLEKNKSTSSLNLESRTNMWDNGLEDFSSSPIWGVGFCATNNIQTVMTTGNIESGSSWINVISMLGIIGAIFIVAIFARAFLLSYKRKDDRGALICGILVLFFIHMFAEGYIFAGGSFLALMLWLTIGVATDSKYR